MALAHEPIGKPGGPGLWGMKGAQLPAFIQHMRNDIMQERGMPEDAATPIAISQCRKLAAKGNAQAMAAMAEFERLQAKAKATRSEPRMSGYDPNGLDSSWDDVSGLPDLTGLGVPEFEAAETALGWQPPPGQPVSRTAKLGSGGRFQALSAELGARGARSPDALAAWIGRRKYGKGKFGQLASAARKKAAPAARSAYGELFRDYPLEDLHIVRTADGGDGRTMEAFAAVFNAETQIRDHEGDYLEVIEPTAFNKRLADLKRSRQGFAQVKVLFNHGRDMEGAPALRFQMPVAVPVYIEATPRGLLTRSRFVGTPLGDEVMELVTSGAITAMSFTGRIVRSNPELGRHGRRRPDSAGRLTTVRRMELGLREFGPVLFPAYEGAAINGVRMSVPGAYEPGEFEDEALPPDEEAVTGGPPEVHPSRDHAHRLLAMRTEEMCREAGMSVLRRTWE